MRVQEKVELKWEKDFTEQYLEALNKTALRESLNFLERFMYRQNDDLHYEVLNAHPGHGKTTALKILIKRVLLQKRGVGALIVLREKNQMKEMEDFAAEFRNGILYVDSENYSEVKSYIPNYQFVLISHERFKNITRNVSIQNSFAHFEKWIETRRIIIVDEAPSFVESSTFELGKGMEWLDDCFKMGDSLITTKDKIMVRSLIQIILGMEFIENETSLTLSLKRHITGVKSLKVMEDFFNIVDHHCDKLSSTESLNSYQWFRKLYYEDQIGYIDSGFYTEGYSDHKKIICAKRIDYRELKSSILILDGTATHTRKIYNEEYIIHELPTHTKYERLKVFQRCINTTARKRKHSTRSVQRLIADDIQNLHTKMDVNPFPLMNKYEVKDYLRFGVIKRNDYKEYFQESYLNEQMLPINILNTVGKNHLANRKDLYLTSLPNRPSSYYQAIAISLYPLEKSLNLSTAKGNKQSKSWFTDPRVEEVYQECLLAELIQIIHRSNIRNLKVVSEEKVHVFIATQHDQLMDKLINALGSEVYFERNRVEKISKFKMKVEREVIKISEKIKREKIVLPKSVGRIEDGTIMKNLIQKNWADLEKRQEIISVFQKFKLDIIEVPLKTNQKKLEKRIVKYTGNVQDT